MKMVLQAGCTRSRWRRFYYSSNIALPLLLGLMLSSCNTRTDSHNYVAVRSGAEDDTWMLMIELNAQSHQISDSLLFLSPLVDNMEREEYSSFADAGKLFGKYQPHAIHLIERKNDGDSISFQTTWFPIYADSVMFHFKGISFPDSIIGSLAISYYVHRLEKSNSDTSSIIFRRSD